MKSQVSVSFASWPRARPVPRSTSTATAGAVSWDVAPRDRPAESSSGDVGIQWQFVGNYDELYEQCTFLTWMVVWNMFSI